MTQSANARPCNCDQAIALELTCATQGRKLAEIERLLLERANSFALGNCMFSDPTLDAIRVTMLERSW